MSDTTGASHIRGMSTPVYCRRQKMLTLIGKRAIGLAGAVLLLSIGNAYGFGNACKNVNFSVDNEFSRGVTVTSFELWSESEGHWLNENFQNVSVPFGARDFIVRRGENVEHGENDRITKIRVHFEIQFSGPLGEIPVRIETASYTSTDTRINDPVCVAGRWYKATIKLLPDGMPLGWTPPG